MACIRRTCPRAPTPPSLPRLPPPLPLVVAAEEQAVEMKKGGRKHKMMKCGEIEKRILYEGKKRIYLKTGHRR